MKILLIEDNQKLSGYLKKAFKNKSYTVECAYDGETGEKFATWNEYDLIILDIMLPKKDGISICRSLRDQSINIPVIMLTAKGELDDKVEGLDSGADDYLVKPFELKELLARIRALLRRPQEKMNEVLEAQDIKLDNAQHRVEKNGRFLSLTLKEYAVLEYLISNKGQVLTRDQILDHCWDFDFDSFSNIVDAYIKQLRKKLGNKNEKYIKTVRGVGYKFQK